MAIFILTVCSSKQLCVESKVGGFRAELKLQCAFIMTYNFVSLSISETT